MHVHLMIDEVETTMNGVGTIDTTGNMDVTITVQWGTAKVGNTISLYQAFMEFKN